MGQDKSGRYNIPCTFASGRSQISKFRQGLTGLGTLCTAMQMQCNAIQWSYDDCFCLPNQPFFRQSW